MKRRTASSLRPSATMAASSAGKLGVVVAAGADGWLVDRELRQRHAAPRGLDHQPAAGRHPVGERLAAGVLDERGQVLDLALDRPRRRVGAVAAAAAVVVEGREALRPAPARGRRFSCRSHGAGRRRRRGSAVARRRRTCRRRSSSRRWSGRSRSSQLRLDDLAHRVAGQLVEEADLARALVRRELGRRRGRSARAPSGASSSATTQATIRSPRSSSGAAVTAASRTPGCSSSATSISPAPTL